MQLAGHPDSNYLEQGLALAALDIVRARQHQDCLYLHSESDNPEVILGAIASSSFLLQEGVGRLKVHGPRWALGVDLPISPDCQMAAQMVELLVQEPKVAGLTFKVLLQQTCLNVLCEFSQPMAQALVALPLLQVIRQTNPAAYFQSVTVSGRVKGERHPAWSFEIDLMALGLAPQVAEEPEVAEDFGEEPVAPPVDLGEPWWAMVSELGRWLFPPERSRELHPSLAALMLVLSVGATLTMDQVLFQRARSVVLPEAEVAESNEIPGDRPKVNFNIAALNEKLTLLEWHRTTYRRSPDVLIVGSSRALRGIDPTALEQSLAAQGISQVRVFNFGIDGATARVAELQLTRILGERALPRMVIWADGLRAFNSSRRDNTYEEIAASEGYQALAQSVTSAPVPTSAPPTERGIAFLNRLRDTVLISYSRRSPVRTDLMNQLDGLTRWLSNNEAIISATVPTRSQAMDAKGFVPFTVRFDPETYFLTHPRVAGEFDNDYRNFEPEGKQFEALTNVVRFTRKKGIPLVVVNLPLHDTYLDGARLRQEDRFQQVMTRLAAEEGFTYVDFSRRWRQDAAVFSDPSHLNDQGAIAVAKALAEYESVPWYQLRGR